MHVSTHASHHDPHRNNNNNHHQHKYIHCSGYHHHRATLLLHALLLPLCYIILLLCLPLATNAKLPVQNTIKRMRQEATNSTTVNITHTAHIITTTTSSTIGISHKNRRDHHDHSNVFQPLLDMLSWPNMTQYRSNPHYPRVTHVALLKTHKTASATLASVLFRYCARHKVTIFKPNNNAGSLLNKPNFWDIYVKNSTAFGHEAANMIISHVSDKAGRLPVSFNAVLAMYHQIIGPHTFISTIRSPLEQALSWACFYALPQNVEELYAKIPNIPDNVQCHEYGVQTEAELEEFIQGNT